MHYAALPSMALPFVTKMSEKPKSTSPSAIQVKNQRKTDGFEEKLDVISQLERREQMIDICRNVRLVHISIYTICDNADRITGNYRNKNVGVARLPQSDWNELYPELWM
jgi:hypothetical protein